MLSRFDQPFFNDYVVPAGYLRESRKGAERADFVIFTKCPTNLNAALKQSYVQATARYTQAQVLFSELKYGKIRDQFGNELEPGKALHLITGIADTKAMIDYLEKEYPILKNNSYRDHHAFTETELKTHLAEAKKAKAALLCTDKDRVKLGPLLASIEAEYPLYSLPVEPIFSVADQSLLLSDLESLFSWSSLSSEPNSFRIFAPMAKNEVSADLRAQYEPVIGIEIHVQLNTRSKAYSSDPTEYGASPNTQTSPITLGHPGTLPMFNEGALKAAVKLGLAVGAQIREVNEFARKNYFYADLPKGYQITQDKTPICNGGFIEVKDDNGNPKRINLTRIHMEEDSGKSSHDIDPFNTLIDLNRAGVPLLEIVTEPDFRSGEEAYQYLTEMQRLVRYLDISDGNMEEGSLRCDVNISVRKVGAEKFGTRVEVKNMNSFRNVQKAIDYEVHRHIALIESGGKVTQQTFTYDAARAKTQLLRDKEDAHDYRYFNEPDLQPVIVSEEYVSGMKEQMPPLPKELFAKYREHGLSEYDASLLTDSKEIALFYEQIIEHTDNYKSAANWIMGSIKSWLNEKAAHISDFPLKAEQIAQLIALVDEGKVSNTAATGELFKALLAEPEKTAGQLAEEKNLIQESNTDELQGWVDAALAKYPDKVAEYKAGKKGLTGLFMGEVMKLSRGKADPKLASKLVQESLEK